MKGYLDLIVNGFLLGLTAGPACFTACVPVLLSVSLAERPGAVPAASWAFVCRFLVGRFGAYLLFGLFMGTIGGRLGTSGLYIGAVATVLMALLLMAYGFGLPLPHAGLCRWASVAGGRHFPILLGVLTGLNVCPPFLLAIAYMIQRTVDPVFGMLFFCAFFVATSLYVLPAALVGYLPDHRLMTHLGRVSAVAVGAYFCFQGVSTLMLG